LDVICVRHATAEDTAPRDRERALTLEGRRESRELGARLLREGIAPELVIASPFVRAVQTAELMAATMGYVGPLRLSRALRPESPPDGVVELLASLEGVTRVILVAHEPVLSSVCLALLGRGKLKGSDGLRRAEAVALDWQPPVPGTARLTWRSTGP